MERETLWGGSPRPITLPKWERVPARDALDLFAEKGDDYVIKSADGLYEWTAGELRELATKGQAIDLPCVLASGIWAVPAVSDGAA